MHLIIVAFLSSVTIEDGDNVVTIGESAFRNTGLTSIIIPKCVTTIRPYAFSYCRYLTNVTIEDVCTFTIGEFAFQNSALTSITIPNSFTSIG